VYFKKNLKRRRIGFGAIVAAILLVAVVLVYGSLKSPEEVARFYFENSTFVSGGATSIMGQLDYQPENAAPEGSLKPAEAVEIDASDVLRHVGIAGRILGTYRFNATHLVTLVEPQIAEFPALYAVVWNNSSASWFPVEFVKYRELEINKTLLRDERYTYVVGQRSVGFVAANLPFTVVGIYDENWGQWNTPTGYFRVTAAGYFTVVYGVAVYVMDYSRYSLSDPALRLCRFNRYVSGSGTPSASVHAYGRADTTTCAFGAGTAFEITAVIGYNAWLHRFAPPATGNKWFYIGPCCS
jgi:hypothetical protein